jgi:hypothetical protein
MHYTVHLQEHFSLSRTYERDFFFSVGTGTKKDESITGRVWAAGFHHVTACPYLARILKLMNRLFNFPLVFSGRGNPRTMNQ